MTILQVGISVPLHDDNVMEVRVRALAEEKEEGPAQRAAGRWAGEQEERRGEEKDHCRSAVYLLLVGKKLELCNPIITARIKNLLLT